MSRTLALALVPLTLLAASLSGCTDETRLPPPEPVAEGEPLFASDDEALAAATAAYEEYLAVSNEVFREPPRDLQPLSNHVTDRFLENELPIAAQFDQKGWVIDGGTELDGTRLQQWFVDANGTATVIFYACVDVSGARILDQSGADVTPSSRPDEVTLEVSLVSVEPDGLLLDRSELWQEGNACA